MEKSELAEFSASLIQRFPLVNDHPDIAGLLRDPEILQCLGEALSAEYVNADTVSYTHLTLPTKA